jgi:hypothetical protein
MNVSDILFAVAIVSVLWGVASAVLIAEALRKRGVKRAIESCMKNGESDERRTIR